MAASISVSNVRVDGDDVVVTVTGSVDQPSTLELVSVSEAESPVDIPTSRDRFSVGAGSFQRDLTIETFVPTGQSAILSITANVTSPETATDTVTVDIQQEGPGGGGADILPIVAVGGAGLAVAWYISNR